MHDNTNNYSDHNTITYKITTTTHKPTLTRPSDKCDWTAFHNDLLKYTFKFPETVTQKTLDLKTDEITNVLTSCLDKICKKRQLKNNISQHTWHTKQLKKDHPTISKAYRLDLKHLIEVITGHNNLKKFSNKIKKLADTNCRLCNAATEDIIHLLTECSCLSTERLELKIARFNPIHSTTDKLTWSIPLLLNFFKLPKLVNLLESTQLYSDKN